MVKPSPPDFAFRNIRKTFGNVTANRDVTFEVAHNTIHGVVGENGAGKSTIMKILYGLYEPDEGQIFVRGEKVKVPSPQAAIALGIGMVHQHFMLVPTMTVWENVVLGSEPLWLDRKRIIAKLDELQKSFGFALDLEARVETLPVGHQQQVELLKLLHRESSILILDEPTAVLTPQEVDALFERLTHLWERGKTIVLITHKLKEILRFTKSVTVMRQGGVVETLPTSSLDEESLAEKIIGRKIALLPPRKAAGKNKVVLEVRDLSVDKGVRGSLKGLSLKVHAGEIVGIAGIEGNGQQALVECLAAANRDYSGEIRLEGESLADVGTYAAKQRGLAVLPPDRHQEGLILSFEAWENFILGHHREARFQRGIWLSRTRAAEATREAMDAFDVRPRAAGLPISGFSGGNQQKLVIAREIWGRDVTGKVRLVIASHPTRGVDIGAIEFIHGRFLALRDEGIAILLVSSELEEIFALSDRIAVLYEGAISGEVSRAAAVESQVGRWMTGCQ